MRQVAFLCLLAGGCAIAFAPILVRLSDTGPVASAFWRVALAAPLLWACLAASREPLIAPRAISRGALLAAGLFFAADLGVWHWSIVYTSVANSTLLANLAPIFVTLAGWLFWKRKVTRVFLMGMITALAGMFVLVGPNFFAGGTRPRRGLAGPFAARAARSVTASSRLSAAGSAPFGTLALTAPCFT